MRVVFADTYYYLALLQPGESGHRRVIEVAESLEASLITTEYVLVELGNSLAHPRHRQLFVDVVNAIRADANTRVVAASAELFDSGLQSFSRHADKHWSLVDCISMEVMRGSGSTEALTADHHFEQAGFTALLK